MPTHYEVLGVAPDASEAQLRAAYFAKVREWDLDRLQGKPPSVIAQADRMTRAINEAWRVLRDPAARARYDAELEGRQEG